jgi:FtsH-binding integral membrane protein
MRAHFTGSIPRVLPVAFLLTREDLISGAGGLAAAIAIGAFAGQAISILLSASELSRLRRTAIGGLLGVIVMSGLILLSANGR